MGRFLQVVASISTLGIVVTILGFGFFKGFVAIQDEIGFLGSDKSGRRLHLRYIQDDLGETVEVSSEDGDVKGWKRLIDKARTTTVMLIPSSNRRPELKAGAGN